MASSSKKKVTKKEASAADRDRVRALVALRRESCKKKIGALNKKELQTMLIQLCDHHPSLIFDVLAHSKTESVGPAPPSPPDPDNSPKWCKCGRCREMPTDLEKLCCDCLPRNCHSVQPDIDLLLLHPQVLALANFYRDQLLGLRDGVDFASKRHAAYRQYVLWRNGYLGAGNRRVVPSCVVWRIRDTFPDPNGNYTGYKPSRFD